MIDIMLEAEPELIISLTIDKNDERGSNHCFGKIIIQLCMQFVPLA